LLIDAGNLFQVHRGRPNFARQFLRQQGAEAGDQPLPGRATPKSCSMPGIPGFNDAVKIRRKSTANVQGFDNVFAEILEAGRFPALFCSSEL